MQKTSQASTASGIGKGLAASQRTGVGAPSSQTALKQHRLGLTSAPNSLLPRTAYTGPSSKYIKSQKLMNENEGQPKTHDDNSDEET